MVKAPFSYKKKMNNVFHIVTYVVVYVYVYPYKQWGRGAWAFRGTFGYGKGTLKYYMDTIWLYILSIEHP